MVVSMPMHHNDVDLATKADFLDFSITVVRHKVMPAIAGSYRQRF
jgi:hypothetical protein